MPLAASFKEQDMQGRMRKSLSGSCVRNGWHSRDTLLQNGLSSNATPLLLIVYYSGSSTSKANAHVMLWLLLAVDICAL